MKIEKVIVHYNGSTLLEVKPDPVLVYEGDAIQFQRSEATVGKIRLTFPEKEFFHTDNAKFAEHGNFDEGDGLVRVGKLPYRTTYKCELLDEKDGGVIASSDGQGGGGGAVEPVKNDK